MLSYSPRPLEGLRSHFSLITLLCLHWSVKVIKTSTFRYTHLIDFIRPRIRTWSLRSVYTLSFKNFSQNLSFFKFGNHFYGWYFFCVWSSHLSKHCMYITTKASLTSTSWMPAYPIKLFCKLRVVQAVQRRIIKCIVSQASVVKPFGTSEKLSLVVAHFWYNAMIVVFSDILTIW